MRRVLAVLCALACGCDGASSSSVDGGGSGHGDGGGGNYAPMASPRTVKLTLVNRPTNAAPFSFFVAYQDGAGEWKTAPAPTGDTYSFEINAPVYGVAWGCIGNVIGNTTTQLRSVSTAHFAVAERTELTFDVPSRCTDDNSPTITLGGQVTNRPFTGVLVVQFGTRTAFVSNQSGGFNLQTPPGTHDLIVSHVVPEGNGEYYIDQTLVIRSLALSQSTTRLIDFSAAQSTRSHEVTVDVLTPSGE